MANTPFDDELEAPKAASPKTDETLDLLKKQLALQLKREEREAKEQERADAERAQAEAAKAGKIAARQLRDKRAIEKELSNQKRCQHLKNYGGQIPVKDEVSNIYAHRLPDGSIFIKCRNQCGMRWNQGDTREFLFRDGKKKPNHTGLSFADMWKRLPHDSFSSSEMLIPEPVVDMSEPALTE